ncbi:transposable element Tc3 transposase [Trichonephila clavipes]|nr:transposable element Tc3 transposase [Trichonephila clavipes]
MYGSTCADMQVDVMGECLSSIKHVVGEQLSGGSVVVVPRGTTPADDRYIVLQARRNRRQTAGEIARHTTQATGRPISRFTVARRLHGGGLFARRPVRCVPLTPAHRRRRSLWCREYRNWRHNEWGRVLFTDESRFSLSSDSHRILIWRERGSRNHPSNISSDHNPIKLHFPRTAKFEILPPQLNTNWNIFTNTLANTENCHIPHATSTPEIESQVRELTSEILAAHAKASRPMTHSEPPFVQGELKQLFKERNRARKLWQFTKFPQHKTELNRIQNKIKRKVGLYRQQVWEDHLTSLDAEGGSLWGTARAFRKKASPISALNGRNGVALSDTNKTELIALSLESQFQLNDIHNPRKDDIITNTVDAYVTNHTNNNTDPIPPRSPIGTNYLH